MSVRTKLLAAVIGLNAAILATALFLQVEDHHEPRQARADLVLAASHPRFGRRDLVRALVLDAIDQGHFREIFVYEPPEDRDQAGVWRAADYYGGERDAQVDDPDLRDEITWYYHEHLEGRAPVYAPDDGTLAIVPHERLGLRRTREYMVLAMPHPPPGGARTLWFVITGGVLVLSGVLFWLISRWILQPMSEISTAADRVAEGDYHVQLPPRGDRDELGRTIRAFNRMTGEMAEYQGHLEDRVMNALGRVRRAEQHLTIAQRLAATGKLAAGLAHEINNPVGGMKNAVAALSRGDLGTEKTAEYLDLVSEGLGRVEQTVRAFLTFTPRETRAERTDLAHVVRTNVGLARHRIDAKGAELDLRLGEGEGEADCEAFHVYGDSHELGQVVLNLLLNAADAVEEGSGRIQVSLSREEAMVVLDVTDDGVGMTPEQQATCFDMFVTSKTVGEGSGLGLAVVHTIVTNHGGRVDLRSAVGEGTTFRVLLPAE